MPYFGCSLGSCSFFLVLLCLYLDDKKRFCDSVSKTLEEASASHIHCQVEADSLAQADPPDGSKGLRWNASDQD